MNTQYMAQHPTRVNCEVSHISIGYDPHAAWVAYRLDSRTTFLPADLAAEFDCLLSYRRIDTQAFFTTDTIEGVMRRMAPYGLAFDRVDAFVAALLRVDRLGDVLDVADQREAA